MPPFHDDVSSVLLLLLDFDVALPKVHLRFVGQLCSKQVELSNDSQRLFGGWRVLKISLSRERSRLVLRRFLCPSTCSEESREGRHDQVHSVGLLLLSVSIVLPRARRFRHCVY